MHSIIKRIIYSLKCKKGASLVSVLVTMFFLTYMGATILYISYTGALIKNTHDYNVKNIYTASELTDYIKAGFQNVVSNSVYTVYENTLKNYENSSNLFSEQTIKNILSYTTNNKRLAMATGTGASGNIEYIFNVAVLAEFLVQAGVVESEIYIEGYSDIALKNAPIQLSGDYKNIPDFMLNFIKNAGTVSYTQTQVVFENITLTYTNPNTHMTTRIKTDIAINAPNYFENAQQNINIQFLPITNYAVIAVNNLKINGNLNMDSIYANSISLPVNSQTNINGALITPTQLIIPESHSLSLNENSEIWAQLIQLEGNAKLETMQNSNVYIANDLTLNKPNSFVEIRGSLFGFGNSTTNANESSAIVINAENTVLNLYSAQRLMLAGNGFIMPPLSTLSQSEILTGESIWVAAMQSAYLAPVEILPAPITTNPYIIQNGLPLPNLSEVNTILQVINGKSLQQYKANVTQLIYPVTGENNSAIYYYLNFDSPENASEYFKDYFEINKQQVADYLNLYTNLSEYNGYMQTRGNVILKSEEGTYTIPEINSVNTTSAQYMQNTYTNICKTLSNLESTVQNPYEFIINTAALNEFISGNVSSGNVYEFTDENGKVTAIVTNMPFTLNSGMYSELDIIICTKDISINTDFDGIILGANDITLGAATNVLANKSGVQSALNSKFNNKVLLQDLLTSEGQNIMVTSEKPNADTKVTDNVKYENYSINA